MARVFVALAAMIAVVGLAISVVLYYDPPERGRDEPVRAAGPEPGAQDRELVAPRLAEPRIEPFRASAAMADGALILPDGARVPGLNGVREPVELLWPADAPFSPITGVQTEVDGFQWYVHADGTRSTTQMLWRSDLGRETAVSVIARPKAAAPMKGASEEEQEARGRKD